MYCIAYNKKYMYCFDYQHTLLLPQIYKSTVVASEITRKESHLQSIYMSDLERKVIQETQVLPRTTNSSIGANVIEAMQQTSPRSSLGAEIYKSRKRSGSQGM
jgi:hypothetical protein